MQCVSCRFENMPGVGVCGRCGSPLGLQTLTVNVHPPRAGSWSKRLRRWNPFRSVHYKVRDARRATALSSWFQNVRREAAMGTPLGVLARLIVPGWAHYYLERRALGRTFLGWWLAFLLLSFLLYGSTFGSVLLGLVFSVHVAACVSILRVGGQRIWVFVCSVFLAFVLLSAGVYLPAGWLFSWIVTPVQVWANAAPLAAGDVFLYCPLLRRYQPPRVGAVVIYNQQTSIQYPLPPPRHGYVVVPAGQRIDRILAGPNDRIYWKDGRLTVNGQPSPLKPLNPKARLPKLELTVSPGCYLILPSTVPVDLRVPEEGWRNLCIVADRDIEGRVLLRSYPWTRLRRFP